MKEEIIAYKAGNVNCEGYIVYDEKIKTPHPTVLVAHAWRGQDDFARAKAKQLANLGYVGFAIDMFGHKKNAANDSEAERLIAPLYLDRTLLQNRVVDAFNFISKHPLVDKSRIGAIGFCFGGLTVIELLRSGAPVKSVVSFHGVLGSSGAKTVPISNNIKGSLLILHGYEDPLVSKEDVVHLQNELNEAGVDWEMNIYGHTAHAFTNPIAKDPAKGFVYNERTANRAWSAMNDFFEETL